MYLIYYYKKGHNLELEFVIEYNGSVIPIEVKAGNTATVSLNSFVDEYEPQVAFKVIAGNIRENGKKYTIPHYMAMFI